MEVVRGNYSCSGGGGGNHTAIADTQLQLAETVSFGSTQLQQKSRVEVKTV